MPTHAADLFDTKIAEELANTEHLADDAQSNETNIRKRHRKELHVCMDTQVASRVQRLKKTVANRNTQQPWILITAAVEVGFIDHFTLEGKDANKMRERSRISTSTTE